MNYRKVDEKSLRGLINLLGRGTVKHSFIYNLLGITIDGTDISGVTVDGADVQEITVDGSTAWKAVIRNGLVHRLRFEGDWNDSVGSWNPSSNGASIYPISNEGEYSGEASGDDKLQVSSTDYIDDSSGIAFVFWLLLDSTDNQQGIFGVNSTDANWYCRTYNGAIDAGYRSSGNNPEPRWEGYTDEIWYSICVQYDGSTMELWVDGDLKDSKSNGDTVDNKYDDNTLFKQKDDRNMDGKIDDFRVYNRTLSSSELADIRDGVG